MLPKDLPGDLPGFVARFGTDAQCRAYLSEARWPDEAEVLAGANEGGSAP